MSRNFYIYVYIYVYHFSICFIGFAMWDKTQGWFFKYTKGWQPTRTGHIQYGVSNLLFKQSPIASDC
jgi:hypothetical protein